MSIVVLTPSAQADIDGIWDYIAQDNPAAADRLIRELEGKCSTLAAMPDIGKPRFDIAPLMRCFHHRRYTVYYRPMASGIQVTRVLHQSRDHAKLTLH